ncbi:hypothetical protein DFH06DRAFT_1318112 [Mycena polygramma]|nr:hypothetical protein DFH06DRAFT_1318112 [Mycena polygramma]
MSCRLSIARVLATSRTQLQSPWAPASVPLASPPLLERRHRPRRAFHHLHRPHKAVCMMPGLWEPEATLPDRPDTLVAALAVRQDAIFKPPTPRTLLPQNYLRVRRSPSLSSDSASAHPSHALCPLPPHVGFDRRRYLPLSVLVYPSHERARTILRTVVFPHARLVKLIDLRTLRSPASYACAGLRDTLTIARSLFAFRAALDRRSELQEEEDA